ncbi:hypothetical protein IFR05_000994 [Cadophora sp. M221]|nr:hypothetical protein IFR05_000994 [Cadophora sp. M221]
MYESPGASYIFETSKDCAEFRWILASSESRPEAENKETEEPKPAPALDTTRLELRFCTGVRDARNGPGDSQPGTHDVMTVNGTVNDIVEIAQQLVFLGSAFATSPTNKIARSYGHISVSRTGEVSISFKVDELPSQETSCWHDLLNPVIVENFPIPKRQAEVGLEIPIEMMAALGGAAHHVVYEGGILIKGFSAMFVPLKRIGDCVQWHFISNSDGSRLPYWEVDGRCPGRALLDQVDEKSVRSTRDFLGWWGETTCQLGSRGMDYENISWTELKEPDRAAKFSGGSIGFQMFGTGELNFSVGSKDSKLHISRPGPYQMIVKYASNTPVVLFDPVKTDRRGWLVSAASVIAHIALTRHARKTSKLDGILKHITEDGLNANEAAEKMLYENAATVLSLDPFDNSSYTFKDLVLGIWAILEMLMDKRVKGDSSPGQSVHLNTSKLLQGWEFMDIVSEKSPMQLKETMMSKSAGNWTDFAQDISAIILFATGFQDLIIPHVTEKRDLCDV